MATKVIYVKTTDTCNLNCDHCFTNGRNGKKGFFDVAATQRWINDYMDQCGHEHHYHLELHGGEPFLAPLSMIEAFVAPYRDRSNTTIGANTNLVYTLTEDHLRFFRDVLKGAIGTSWDNGIRFDTPAQERKWRNNLGLLREWEIPFKLQVSVSRSVVDMNVHDFLRLMETFGPTNIALERLTANGSAERNPVIFPDNETQDLWHLDLYKAYKAGEWSFSIGTFDTIETRLAYNVVKADTNCRNCEQHLATLSADGHLSGCPNSAGDVDFSRLADGAEGFLNSKGRRQEITRELDFHPNCLSCDVFDICGGDCHRLTWQDGRCAGLKHLLRHMRGDDRMIPAIQVG